MSGDTQHGWFIRENPTKMDDWEVPLFQETTMSLVQLDRILLVLDGQGASPSTPPRGKMSHWCRCPESALATSWEISPDPQTSLASDGMGCPGFRKCAAFISRRDGQTMLGLQVSLFLNMCGIMKGSMKVPMVCSFLPCASDSNLAHMNLGCHGCEGDQDYCCYCYYYFDDGDDYDHHHHHHHHHHNM